MKGEIMKIDDIMDLIKGLTRSQGMYGRLLKIRLILSYGMKEVRNMSK